MEWNPYAHKARTNPPPARRRDDFMREYGGEISEHPSGYEQDVRPVWEKQEVERLAYERYQRRMDDIVNNFD